MFIIYFHTKFCVPYTSCLLVIAMKPKAKKNVCAWPPSFYFKFCSNIKTLESPCTCYECAEQEQMCIAPLDFNFCMRRRWVVSITLLQLYPQKGPSTHWCGGWVVCRARLDVFLVRKSLLTGIQTLIHPACSLVTILTTLPWSHSIKVLPSKVRIFFQDILLHIIWGPKKVVLLALPHHKFVHLRLPLVISSDTCQLLVYTSFISC